MTFEILGLKTDTAEKTKVCCVCICQISNSFDLNRLVQTLVINNEFLEVKEENLTIVLEVVEWS